MDEANSDVQYRDSAHRESAGEETLDRVPDHDSPDVGERDITDDGDGAEGDEKA